ncbi:MAG: methionyl-tRNA formyltransferase [Bacilli bacterium]|nr:methionyl-tRNA formyltransferase [Bacilli bacterium]
MKNLKVVFMGTPTFSVPVLEKLIKETNVILVVSQPDREKDRKGNILPTPTKKLALDNNIEVYQPTKIKEEYEKIIKLNPDIIITCAYGQIIPEVILNQPKHGCINVHGSLLPKLRGGAPIHHAIINGDKVTGITIMYMDKLMDSGDIISQEKLEILDNDNLDTVYEKMSHLGASLLIKTLPSIINGTNQRIKQQESDVTFGYNITKEEEKIDFTKNSKDIHNHIRGLSSNPGAYCLFEDKRLKIYKSELTKELSSSNPGTIIKIDKTGIYVNTKDYIIKLIDIKLEGKKRCLVKDFINGIKIEEYLGKALR